MLCIETIYNSFPNNGSSTFRHPVLEHGMRAIKIDLKEKSVTMGCCWNWVTIISSGC
jgi:hypothetical protein